MTWTITVKAAVECIHWSAVLPETLPQPSNDYKTKMVLKGKKDTI
jgi:hypothetical protein